MNFPPLSLADWKETRNSLQTYAKIIGKIKQPFFPEQKHFWHIALSINSTGLTTTPFWLHNQLIEIELNLTHHLLTVKNSLGEQAQRPLHNLSPHQCSEWLIQQLNKTGPLPTFNLDSLQEEIPLPYNPASATTFWQALSQIYTVFHQFRSQQRAETGPILLWPHHFDLAMLIFSGRLVPDQDPNNPEYADEQMNFGFVTGDETISEPYFYVTAYPMPDQWTKESLPPEAYWFTESFNAAILPYSALCTSTNPQQLLLGYLTTAHQSATNLRNKKDQS